MLTMAYGKEVMPLFSAPDDASRRLYLDGHKPTETVDDPT